MKKNYTLIFLMLFSLIGYAQNFDHIYSDTVEGSAVEINYNDISFCQSNVVLNITEFQNLTFPNYLCDVLFVKYKVFVNDVEIGDYCTGEAQSFDLSSYGSINNVKIIGYNVYNGLSDTIRISANLVVSSSLVAMPATGPTTSELSYCLNTSATALTATLTEGATRLKWYTTNSGGLPSNSITPNTSVPGSTTYWVSQADATGCESERSSVVVTIYDVPNLPTAEAQAFCESGTVSDLVPAPSATIVWYDVETEGVALSTTTDLTTGTYYVSEVNANGCESERVSVNVTINSILAPISEAQVFCASGTVADLVPSPSATILWYDVETEGVALSSTTDLATGTYYVSEASTNGCESERTLVSVTVGSIVPVDAGAPTVTFCDNAIMPITATASINGFNDNYAPSNWAFLNTNSDGNIDTTNAPNSIVLTGGDNGSGNSGNSSYSILCAIETTISFDWNYATTDYASSYDFPQVLVNGVAMAFDNFSLETTQSGTMEVIIPAGETFGFNMFTTDNSYGSASVQISNFVASIEDGISSYSWAATAGGTITGSTTSASMMPATSGTYTVTAIDINGCTITDSVDVTITETPDTPTISSPVTYNLGDTASALTATSGGTGLLWYTTETGDTILTEAPTPDTSTVGSTSYWVSSINAEGCESERSEIIVNVEETLGLNTAELLNGITVFPNPTNGLVTISNALETELEVSVYDINGRLLFKIQDGTEGNKLDLSRFSSGIYLLKIKTDLGEVTKRVIKN